MKKIISIAVALSMLIAAICAISFTAQADELTNFALYTNGGKVTAGNNDNYDTKANVNNGITVDPEAHNLGNQGAYAADSSGFYYIIEMSSKVDVSTINIYTQKSGTSSVVFTVYASDNGSDWGEPVATSASAKTGSTITIEISSCSAKYVKLQITEFTADKTNRLPYVYEIEVLGTSDSGSTDSCEHTPVEIPAVDATCTTAGSTAGSKCSKCEEVLTAPETVDVLGHTEQTNADGSVTCSVCGETLKEAPEDDGPAGLEKIDGITVTVNGEAADKLTDGNTETDGMAFKIPTGIIDMDLGEVKAIDVVKLYNGYNGNAAYDLYVSADGATWKYIGTRVKTDAFETPGNYVTMTVNGSYRYLKLLGGYEEDGYGANWAACVSEVDVLDANGEEIAIVSSSDKECAYGNLNKLTNNDIGNEQYWLGFREKNGEPTSAIVDLGSSQALKAFKVVTDGSVNIYTSTDNAEWTLVGTVDGSNNMFTALEAVTAQYVKIEANQCLDFNVYEVEVYKETSGAACTHETTETVAGKAATCTEAGLTEGKKCSECGEITVAQETIAATGHTEETVAGKAATCTEAGLTEGKKCSVCGAITVAQEEIAAKSHTEETVAGKAATCTEAGLTEGKKCSVCGETTVAQEEIAATGHTEKTNEDGSVVCEVCGEALKAPQLGDETVFTIILMTVALLGMAVVFTKKVRI